MATASEEQAGARRTTSRSRRSGPDAVAAAAVDLAAAAAADAAGGADLVGEHLGVDAQGERLVAHRFASAARGYRGWVWSVTMARVPRARAATVCEAVLLPEGDALTAPAWLPWDQRLRPGDLSSSDVLPYRADDDRLEPGDERPGGPDATDERPGGPDATDEPPRPEATADDDRLDPGYTASGDDADAAARWELGLGRRRVLSPVGRDEAADRWYDERGPGTASARAASAQCSTCGFYLPVAGSMRQVFGVCANGWSPDDGTVVSADHGCGAHSETDVVADPVSAAGEPYLDETGYDPLGP